MSDTVFLGLEAGESGLEVLIDDVVDSPDRLTVEFSFALQRGYSVWFELVVNGRHRANGMTAAADGLLLAQCRLNSFRETQATTVGPGESLPEGLLQISDEDSPTWRAEEFFRLFFSFCALDAPSVAKWAPPHVICHAAGYPHEPWWAPMVCHHDLRGFGHDFELMRQLYWEGGSPALFFSKELQAPSPSLLAERRISLFEPRVNHPEYVRAYEGVSEEEVRRLFESLNPDGIDGLLSASARTLREWIEAAADEVGDTWVPAKQLSGGVVVSDRLQEGDVGHLFEFYRALWRRANDG